jgi:hypothetical protein
MDWQTILTSVASSGVVTAGICYVIKKTFDRTLELKIEQLKEERKAEIQESMRRKAFLYDKQYEALKLSVSLVYRLRNAYRDVLVHISERDAKGIQASVKQLHAFSDALREVLFTERATLPGFIFDMGHDLAKKVGLVNIQLESLRANRTAPDELYNSKHQQIEETYDAVDVIYERLTSEVHSYLGITENPGT